MTPVISLHTDQARHRQVGRIASHLFGGILAALFTLASPGATVRLNPIDVADELDFIRSRIANAVPIQDVVISGTVRVDRNVLVAKTLTFKAGSELLFSQRALQTGHEMFVIAAALVLEDPAHPGRITWEAPPGTPGPQPLAQAPTGQNGTGEGAVGLTGTPGSPGAPGAAGASAPTVVVFVPAANAVPLEVVLQGTPGQAGGKGQDGGVGGNGAIGESASQSAFDCKRGPGWGGRGGNGGDGGAGGPGGQGGDGGSLILISKDPTAVGLKLTAPGGAGGAGGRGGQGGRPGTGGPEGSLQLPWCHSAGRHGPDGNPGADAHNGADGLPGKEGDIRLVAVPQELIDRIAGQDLGVNHCYWLNPFCKS